MINASTLTASSAFQNLTSVREKLTAKQVAIVLARTTLVAVCALMMFAAVHPDTRNAIRSAFMPNQRQVISTAQAHLAGDARNFTIAKVKSEGSLSLEIFENYGNGQQKLVEKIVLPDTRDGFFDFHGHATNLAVSDINDDGRPEILAPSFDSNLVGHLNVYGFDPESNAFQKIVR